VGCEGIDTGVVVDSVSTGGRAGGSNKNAVKVPCEGNGSKFAVTDVSP
jgi:hypothetical protein